MDISEVTKNTKLLINGIPYVVEGVNFVKPGKGRGIYYLKLRNLLDGSTRDETLHSGDRVEEANVTSHEMQYLYEQGGNFVFMDNETFEQYSMTGKQFGTKSRFFKEGTVVNVMVMHGKPIDIIIPKFVELKVVEVAASTKTDTITAQTKMVVLETGYTIAVPTFVKGGDTIKVDTRNGTYVERVSQKK